MESLKVVRRTELAVVGLREGLPARLAWLAPFDPQPQRAVSLWRRPFLPTMRRKTPPLWYPPLQRTRRLPFPLAG